MVGARTVALGALAMAAGANGFAVVSVPAATDLRARPAASTARSSAFAVRMSGAPGSDKETQTNTGRFSSLVDFDHSGMNDKEFREALKEKMGRVRAKSQGSKGAIDYMNMLNGGAAPEQRRDNDDNVGGEVPPRRKSIWDK